MLHHAYAPSDPELITGVRSGDLDAYGELFARHADAALRLARQLTTGPEAEDLVSEAFAKVMGVLSEGGGPDVAFRAYLLTAVRRLYVDRVRREARLTNSADMAAFDSGVPFQDTVVSKFESSAAARAFASLPERWQLVLWHLEVENQKPAEVARLLGMTPNSVAALAYRAREGLRQAFLTAHLADTADLECRWTVEHLGGYVRKGLSRRDGAKVETHLDACRSCTAMHLELTDINSDLRGVMAPVLLGAAAAGYLAAGAGSGAGVSFLMAVAGRIRDVFLGASGPSAGAGAGAGAASTSAGAVGGVGAGTTAAAAGSTAGAAAASTAAATTAAGVTAGAATGVAAGTTAGVVAGTAAATGAANVGAAGLAMMAVGTAAATLGISTPPPDEVVTSSSPVAIQDAPVAVTPAPEPVTPFDEPVSGATVAPAPSPPTPVTVEVVVVPSASPEPTPPSTEPTNPSGSGETTTTAGESTSAKDSTTASPSPEPTEEPAPPPEEDAEEDTAEEVVVPPEPEPSPAEDPSPSEGDGTTTSSDTPTVPSEPPPLDGPSSTSVTPPFELTDSGSSAVVSSPEPQA